MARHESTGSARRVRNIRRGATAALVVAAVAGVLFVWRLNDIDALREIGGALISGALIGGAILAFEEAAEHQRQEIADEREDRYERNADDRLAREDRLHVWRTLDDAFTSKLRPVLFALGGVTDSAPLIEHRIAVENLRDAYLLHIDPVLQRLEDGSKPKEFNTLVARLAVAREYSESRNLMLQTRQELFDLSSDAFRAVGQRRVAERSRPPIPD